MRILIIDVNCKGSSTGNLVYQLKKYIEAAGNTAMVCYGRGKRIKEDGIYKFGIDIETYQHAFMTRLTGYTGCYSHFSTRQLIRKIEQFKPDIVHIHELHAYFVNDVELINYLSDHQYKIVITAHCEYYYTGKCGHSYECERWKTGCGNCPHPKDYIATPLFDHTSVMYDRKRKAFEKCTKLWITVPSDWSRDRIRDSFLGKCKTQIIYNGVDTAFFHPLLEDAVRDTANKFHIEINKKIILSVAPNIMSEKKGGDTLLRLASLDNEKDHIYVLVGNISKKFVNHPRNMIILPMLSNVNELVALYSMADLFVLCSKKETYSLTCAEALCTGTRIVGYKCGAPETVFTTENAEFVEQGDFSALQMKIREKLKVSWGVNDRNKCAEDAAKLYGSATMKEQYMRLYRSIMDEG